MPGGESTCATWAQVLAHERPLTHPSEDHSFI